MSNITWAQGNYGRVYPLQCYPVDGKQFTATELGTANFVFRMCHKDSCILPIEANSSDKYLLLNRLAKLYLYKVNDKLIIDGELMTVLSIDIANRKLEVDRPNPIPHLKNCVIKHIIYESNIAVEYDHANYRIIFTPQIDMADIYPFRYIFEVEISTPDRKATSFGPRPNDIFTIKIMESGEGI